MHLDEERFLSVIEATPLVSIDLILRDAQNRVLLGQRSNRPAQGFWFVPGGRIRKNERVAEALQRISRAELGAPALDAKLLGAYDHLYPDNFLGRPGISTHYVVLGFACALPPGTTLQPDLQHSELRWWEVPALLASPEVHENTKLYFR